MKTYACYPGVRSRFQPMGSAYVRHNPYYSSFNAATEKANFPASNIVRKEGAYEIQLAVPGLSKDKIRIEVIEDQLVISAVAPTPDATTEKINFTRQEFDYSGIKRTFRLQKNANTSALTASFNEGILTIVIPDREPESKKIEIQ